MDDLKKLIREIPDFPKPGILFYDITTLLKDKQGFRASIDGLKAGMRAWAWTSSSVLRRVDSSSPPLSPMRSARGSSPCESPRKLPAEIASVSYELEYGTDRLEIHKDAILQGCRALIVDDLLATGGTARAVTELVRQLGGTVVGAGFVVELTFLKGREKLNGYDVFSLLQYDK